MEPASFATATMKVATKLIGINALPLLWFIGGAAVTLGLSHIGGSKDSQHVYELRMYRLTRARWML